MKYIYHINHSKKRYHLVDEYNGICVYEISSEKSGKVYEIDVLRVLKSPLDVKGLKKYLVDIHILSDESEIEVKKDG